MENDIKAIRKYISKQRVVTQGSGLNLDLFVVYLLGTSPSYEDNFLKSMNNDVKNDVITRLCKLKLARRYIRLIFCKRDDTKFAVPEKMLYLTTLGKYLYSKISPIFRHLDKGKLYQDFLELNEWKVHQSVFDAIFKFKKAQAEEDYEKYIDEWNFRLTAEEFNIEEYFTHLDMVSYEIEGHLEWFPTISKEEIPSIDSEFVKQFGLGLEDLTDPPDTVVGYFPIRIGDKSYVISNSAIAQNGYLTQDHLKKIIQRKNPFIGVEETTFQNEIYKKFKFHKHIPKIFKGNKTVFWNDISPITRMNRFVVVTPRTLKQYVMRWIKEDNIK